MILRPSGLYNSGELIEGCMTCFQDNNNDLSIDYMGKISLHDLKKWVDEQIANGFNKSEIRLSYGYEDDIESVDFIVSK